MNKPFMKTGFLGLLVIGMSVVLLMVFPSKAPWMMDGFFTPIIAFEFVQSQSEVCQLFGLSDSPDQLSMIKAMDFGNRLDYIYMVLYSSFLFFFSFVCAKNTGQRYYYAGSMLSFIILVADALENIQLLRITAKITSQDFGKELSLLHCFTWIKWGGITVVFLILAPYFFKGRSYSKVIAAIGISSFILSVLAYLNRSVLNELLGLSVALMFLLMIVYSFIYKTES
jgi:hypothetical protein